MNFELILDRLLPEVDKCRDAAEALRRDHPHEIPIELARRAVRSAKLRAATAGAATGAASTPITMIPAAIADMATVLKIEGTLIGVVAALLDPEAIRDPKVLRADVVSIVFPAAASQALRQMGIRAGERLSQVAVRKYATEDLVRAITRLASRYLGKQLTRETILLKAVPLVGIGIGAGWNWLEVQAIGARAIRYYTNEAIGATSTSKTFTFPRLAWRGQRSKPG